MYWSINGDVCYNYSTAIYSKFHIGSSSVCVCVVNSILVVQVCVCVYVFSCST